MIIYMVDFPRDGDANYNGVWGHSSGAGSICMVRKNKR